MKHNLLNNFNVTVALIALCATAIAIPALAEGKQKTPGYNDKTAGKIAAANKVKTRRGSSLEDCAAAERILRSGGSRDMLPLSVRRAIPPGTSDQALWTLIRNRSKKLCFSG